MLASLLAQTDRLPEAVTLWEGLIQRNVNSLAAYFYLSSYYVQTEDWERARQILDEGLPLGTTLKHLLKNSVQFDRIRRMERQ